MAKGKPGKESEVTKKLLKDQVETDKRDADRHEENVVAEAKALEPVEEVKVPKEADKARKARYDALLEAYAEANPVKYAAKKEAGEFKDIPDGF